MHDLIIVGAGPAGLTAGIYAGRFRLNTVIFEKMVTGGRILLAETIENFPGFNPSISTHQLIKNMEEQVKGLGVNILSDEVKELDCDSLEINTENKKYSAKSVIIATGARARKLDVPGEDKFIGKGVSYCATCDGPFYKNKKVIVVGAGNTAAEEALYLARFTKEVILVHRRDQLRASAILQERLKENKKISFILSSVVTEIKGSQKVGAVKIKNKDTQEERLVDCDGIFIYVGIMPNTDFVKNRLQMDEVGFIITDNELQTSRRGIFACGDCRKKSLYQMVNACGEGAVAADSANRYLLNLR